MRQNRRFCLPRVERLEPRQVLAAGGVVALNDDGLLSVLGTSKRDRIEVSLQGDQIVVALNGAKHSFAAADVAHLELDGRSGDDHIWVADTVLIDAVIRGGNGHDKLKGGGGNDTLLGGTGHDQLDGGGGNDSLDGAQGHDKLSGGDGDDTLSGGVGHDSLAGGAGDDVLNGHVGNDKLSGGDGDDTLLGGGGNDSLDGGAGNDTLDGAGGHDKLKGGDGDDQLLGGGGHDEIFGDAGNDWLDGGAGHDKLKGGLGDDKLKGGAGNDQLDGNEGANLLDGDAGKNVLKNGTVVDFETLPPPPPPQPPEDPFQPLAASLVTWNGQGTCTGHAAFERQTSPGGLETFLHVVLNGFAAGLIMPVVVNDSWVGEILIDSTGFGELKLSTIVDEPNEQPFEPGFALAAGATIYVGEELSGTFVEV
jgi:Ca2+-binding RTX toxin-like protein